MATVTAIVAISAATAVTVTTTAVRSGMRRARETTMPTMLRRMHRVPLTAEHLHNTMIPPIMTITAIMVTTMRNIKFLALAALTFALASCSDGVVFQQSKNFPKDTWVKDTMAVFNYDATDTKGLYDVVFDIRNTDDYPYQNFYLFANSYSPDGKVYRDTLECVLADNDGRWIGEGAGSHHHLPVSFFKSIQFPKRGTYRFELIQGMRNDSLHGISDIGIRIMHTPNPIKR